MLKSLLSRIWQRITKGSSRPQVNDVKAVEFREFYQKELIEAFSALGYDIQFIEDERLNRLDD